MKWLFLVLLPFFSIRLSSYPAQRDNTQTEKIEYPAYFSGLLNRESIHLEELIQARKMLIRAQGMKVTGFTMTLECPYSDIIVRQVTSDSLSDEDIQVLRTIRRSYRYDLSFDNIIAKGGRGEVFRGKSFYFLLKK